MEQLLINKFLAILNMSITASYVIIFVLFARVFLKKTLKIFAYSLWGVVLFRLISPLSFSFAWSFLSVLDAAGVGYIPKNTGMMQNPQINVGSETVNNAINQSLPAVEIVASVNPMQILLFVLTIIWIIGVVTMVAYSIISYIRLKNRVSTGMIMNDNIYECENISSPFVLGIFKPKIYLPLGLLKIEKNYIIKHEQIHIKRFDYIIKPFSFLVLCIHWFNPLVWLSFILMSKDMEMSCDEKVLKVMGSDIKRDYSFSLLSFANGKKVISGSPLAFGENNSKSRIRNVLNYKKPEFWMVIVAVILVVLISIGLITNPKDNEQDVSFLNIDHIVAGITQKEQLIIADEEGAGSLVSRTQLFKALEFKGWQEKEVSSPYELSPSMTLYINNEEEYKICFYESEPELAMFLHGDKYRYFTIPKGNYDYLDLMRMASSFLIPKEVMQLVTSGKKINLQNGSKFFNVENQTRFSMGKKDYRVYEKNKKYYCESVNVFIHEISEAVYYSGLKVVEEYGFIREVEENKNALEPTIAKWSRDQSIGADMVVLDFASNDIVIFHDYFGLFVYDLNKLQIVRSLDLEAINCNATQGDEYCEVKVSANGNTINLHSIKSDEMYVYSVLDNTLYETDYKPMENSFSKFVPIKEAIGLESGNHSYSAVAFNLGEYGYLYTYDGTLGTLDYVRSDMVYELFGFMEDDK